MMAHSCEWVAGTGLIEEARLDPGTLTADCTSAASLPVSHKERRTVLKGVMLLNLSPAKADQQELPYPQRPWLVAGIWMLSHLLA